MAQNGRVGLSPLPERGQKGLPLEKSTLKDKVEKTRPQVPDRTGHQPMGNFREGRTGQNKFCGPIPEVWKNTYKKKIRLDRRISE